MGTGSPRVLIWDFDGTLARREGMFSGTLLEILLEEAPALVDAARGDLIELHETIDREILESYLKDRIRPHLAAGFPWHTPETTRPAGRSSQEWWDELDGVFELAFAAVGADPESALRMARSVRRRYPLLERWRLYDDTIPALTSLSALGWRHVILSNHVPELGAIIAGLGLDRYLDAIFNSAVSGYEKPHPLAFRSVLEAVGNGTCWMIGDSVTADVGGAESVGIPAILVRSRHEGVRFCRLDLSTIANIVEEERTV